MADMSDMVAVDALLAMKTREIWIREGKGAVLWNSESVNIPMSIPASKAAMMLTFWKDCRHRKKSGRYRSSMSFFTLFVRSNSQLRINYKTLEYLEPVQALLECSQKRPTQPRRTRGQTFLSRSCLSRWKCLPLSGDCFDCRSPGCFGYQKLC